MRTVDRLMYRLRSTNYSRTAAVDSQRLHARRFDRGLLGLLLLLPLRHVRREPLALVALRRRRRAREGVAMLRTELMLTFAASITRRLDDGERLAAPCADISLGDA